MRLKEVLKVSDGGSILNIWHAQVVLVLESFLENVKASIQQQLSQSPIVISYSNDIHSEAIQKTAELLRYIFTSMGMPTTLAPLVDADTLSAQLDAADYAIVLCTSEYAAKVGKHSPIWNVLDNFGKKKKNALHPLLCEGEFTSVALKIVDGHYLIHSFHAVLNQDPLMAIPALVDIVLHLSGSQGLGLLPDVLKIKEAVNTKAEVAYKECFNALQTTIQNQTIDYRLKASLEKSIEYHSLKSLEERPNINIEVERFLPSEAKVGLFFTQNKADTELTSLHLCEILRQNTTRVLTIDCRKYLGKASWDCVRKALKALQLKSADIAAMKQEPLIIVLKGYQDLGAYDNLWVKNALSTWASVKLLVTCQADYFKERGYLRCFLADVSNRRVEDIAVYSVPTFASLEAQMASLSITVAPDAHQEVEQYPISDKRKAEHAELTRFLDHLNHIWVGKDYLKSALHQNPKLFISYAWEDDKTDAGKKALARQQMYLSRIAKDFKTLGIPVWLDTEQMSGNIDEQMRKNIAESDGVLVIETPRYIERSQQNTNVKKEWNAIYTKSQQQRDFSVFPVQYLSCVIQENQTLSPNEMPLINAFLANHANRCDFTNIDNDYVLCMTHPESGLISRWLCDTPQKKTLYQNAYGHFQQALLLLVGKHLIVNQGQEDMLAFDMSNRLKGYIAPFGLYTEDFAMDSRFDLVKHFEEFLNNQERKTAIVLGKAGSGKSLFALSTFKQLLQPWVNYQNTHQEKPRWLPIYIQLRNYAQQPEHAVQNALKQQFRLTDADIVALKQGLNHQQQILFILDGYDELGSGVRPNYAEVLKDWPHAKVLITSRLEHFDKDHRPLETLALKAADGKIMYSSVQEAYVSPFSPNEIAQYIKQYEGGKESNTYQTLKDLPGMMVLLDNPFLLTLVLQSLPQLLANHQQVQERNIGRVDIYEAFTQTWFLQETKGRALRPEDCHAFCESLAYRLFSEKIVEISHDQSRKLIEDFFFHQPNRAVQDAAPMQLSSRGYSFLHKSLYEYFVAKRFWKAILEPDWLSIWQVRMLTEEQNIVDFLVEIFQHERSSSKQNRLFELIMASRNPEFSEISSSNAMTVLNAARINFSDRDLSHVRIPGAILSGAMLDNTNLEYANLNNVKFTGAWLHRANLSYAQMDNVEFGEYPSIFLETPAYWGLNKPDKHFCISIDYRYFAVCIYSGIDLYDINTKSLIRTYRDDEHDQSKRSRCIDISPDSKLLASGNERYEVKIWSIESGEQFRKIYFGDVINCVRFSFNSKLISIAGESKLRKLYDNRVMLWSIENDKVFKILDKEHRDPIHRIDFNTDKKLLASSGVDGLINIWSLENGELLKTINMYGKGGSNCAAFSFSGKILASAGSEITLWHIPSALLYKKVETRNDIVTAVQFSPDDRLLAFTYLSDFTVYLWLVEKGIFFKKIDGLNKISYIKFSTDGKLLATCGRSSINFWMINAKAISYQIDDHKSVVSAYDINPKGNLIASCSGDKIVKLWSLQNKQHSVSLKHTKDVSKVLFSSDGKLLATCGSEGLLNLWDVETAKLLHALIGHSESYGESVKGIDYSPNQKLIASCGGRETRTIRGWSKTPNEETSTETLDVSKDNTVRLWSIETGQLLNTLNGHNNLVVRLQFSPNSEWVLSSSLDNTIKVWCVASGLLYKTLDLSNESKRCKFSPDDNFIIFDDSNTIKLWDVKSNGCKIAISEIEKINHIDYAFKSDEAMLAAYSIQNGSIKLCSVRESRLLMTIPVSNDNIKSLYLSADGKFLLVTYSTSLSLWDISRFDVDDIPHCTIQKSFGSISFYKNKTENFIEIDNIASSIRLWEIKRVNNILALQLVWSNYQNQLCVKNLNLDKTNGLSLNNVSLLLQRGALGKPILSTDQPVVLGLLNTSEIRPLNPFNVTTKGASSSASSPIQSSQDKCHEVTYYSLVPKTQLTKDAAVKLFSEAAKKASGMNNSEGFSKTQEAAMVFEIDEAQITKREKNCVIS